MKADQNNWLFISGAPRSGTTMLASLLNRSPAFSINNEVNIFKLEKKINQLYYRERRVRDILKKMRLKSTRESWTGEDILSQVPNKRWSKSSVLSTLMTLPGKNDDAILGDKLPLYYQMGYGSLLKIVPNSFIMHLSRNPLQAISSMISRRNNARLGRDYWDPHQTVFDMINMWVEAWNVGIQHVKHPRILNIKYEDILSDWPSLITELVERKVLSSQFSFDPLNVDSFINKGEPVFLGNGEEKELIIRHLSVVVDLWDRDFDKLLELGALPLIKPPIGLVCYQKLNRVLDRTTQLIQGSHKI